MPQHEAAPEQTDSMLAAALGHAGRGWRVFPNNHPVFLEDGTVACSCRRGAGCHEKHRGKHPRPRGWQRRATTNEREIRRFWSKNPECDWRNSNVGLACGRASNLLVLDVDRGEGERNLEALALEGKTIPTTVTVITGSDGHQFYFTHPDLDFDPPPQSWGLPGHDSEGCTEIPMERDGMDREGGGVSGAQRAGGVPRLAGADAGVRDTCLASPHFRKGQTTLRGMALPAVAVHVVSSLGLGRHRQDKRRAKRRGLEPRSSRPCYERGLTNTRAALRSSAPQSEHTRQ